MADPEQLSAVDAVRKRIQDLISDGVLLPGDPLRETEFAARFGVARNTLREAFRVLARDRLVDHEPHRGVSVSRPGLPDAIDIYRVRRLVEVTALHDAPAGHPGGSEMAAAVADAREAASHGDWRRVGTANARFHGAIVSLADSRILNDLSEVLWARLRLVFHIIGDPRRLHEPYVDDNAALVEVYRSGSHVQAAEMLREYLERSEAQITSAYIMKVTRAELA